jgi:hypothetical protein
MDRIVRLPIPVLCRLSALCVRISRPSGSQSVLEAMPRRLSNSESGYPVLNPIRCAFSIAVEKETEG